MYKVKKPLHKQQQRYVAHLHAVPFLLLLSLALRISALMWLDYVLSDGGEEKGCFGVCVCVCVEGGGVLLDGCVIVYRRKGRESEGAKDTL